MCGVFWYIWEAGKASKKVVDWLSRLEYRGYDSAGICAIDNSKNLEIIKSVGKVASLKLKTENHDLKNFHIAIGHTRWATHGWVNEINCHPHISSNNRFAVVHNGIIENYLELKTELQNLGHQFYSETDTEIAAKLFEENFNGNYIETLALIKSKMHGAYGLVFVDRENPDLLFGIKKGSPMVLGFGKNEKFVSSDYRALIGLIDDYIILEDGDIFTISSSDYNILPENPEEERKRLFLDETEKPAELGDFQHFMLKEIFDQGSVIRDVYRGRIDFENYELHSETLAEISKKNYEKIIIIASGTSYHSGLLGAYYLEEFGDIPTEVIVSAEFKYKKKFINDKTLFVFVSQSGETADALDSLKIIKEKWGHTFGIVNVPGSTIARLTGQGLYTRAGIEIWVASTKAFTSQVITFLIMALYLGKHKNLDYRKYREILSALEKLPYSIEKILDKKSEIQKIAKNYAKYKNFFYIGRSLELPVAMEGSLKLKEISYIHSESYASGELKHGSIALIDENFPTIIINGKTSLYEKNISSVQEIKARGGKVIGVVTSDDNKKNIYDEILEFDSINPEIDVILETVILQLFAYFVALDLGREIDKPRNLAKSVTVE